MRAARLADFTDSVSPFTSADELAPLSPVFYSYNTLVWNAPTPFCDQSGTPSLAMSRQGENGYKRIISAAGYSLKGLTAAYRHEAAFRQEVLLALLLAPVALWLGDTHVERAILIGSLALVIITELMNSAIESIVDRIGPDHHELSGRAKDMGSAAVFISLINVVVIWAIIIFK